MLETKLFLPQLWSENVAQLFSADMQDNLMQLEIFGHPQFSDLKESSNAMIVCNPTSNGGVWS
jgi:hypothetical protein